MRRLPARLLFASAAFVVGLVVLATMSVQALRSALGLTQDLARRQIETLNTNERLDDLLFQKGYVSDYLATKNPRWLAELDDRKKATRAWIDQVASAAVGPEQHSLAERLRRSYDEYDESRERLLDDARQGRTGEIPRDMELTHRRINGVLEVAHALAAASRSDLLITLAEGEHIFRRTELWIAILTALTATLSVAFGLWVSRRIARPIYELILQVESAQPERVRVDTGAGPTDELSELSLHVRGLLEQVDVQRRRLLQAEKMEALGEISAKLAHEILNPVAGAKAAIQALARTTALPAETRATLGEVDRTLSRIDTILTRLVRYARPLEPRLQLTPVAELIARSLEASRHEVDPRRLLVETSMPQLPAAEIDLNLMVQVLSNLIVNAAQASNPGGVIRVEALREPGELILKVHDRGHGLPVNREKLFRAFFTTREHGNGLGLATCRNIVAEHGGTVEAVDGQGGIGATFVVTLPQRAGAWKNQS